MIHKKICLLIGVVTLLLFVGCIKDDDGGGLKTKATWRLHPTLEMLPIPAGLGVNIHFFKGNEKDLSMLTEAGVGIVRMDVSWSSAEKTPGKYDFNHYDHLSDDLEQRNIRLLFIIDYGNPLYDSGLSPHTDECRVAYARFCAALAQRYAGKKIIWELWNEPNVENFWKPKPNIEDYMAWCKAVVPTIRQADPDACIVAPATSGSDISFLEECFRQGLLDIIDGVTVHPYRNPELAPETALSDYNQIATLIEYYKPYERTIPIISGEWGYSTTLLSRELQGKYLPRQWLSNTAHNIPISIWYDWHDDGQDPQNTEHNFGTVTWDYKQKPVFVAMKILISQLYGYTPVGRIGVGNVEDYVTMFVDDDNVKLAIWTTGEPHEIDLSDKLKLLAAVDYLGQPINISSRSKFKIDDGPRYLSLAIPLPRWLQIIIRAHKMSDVEAQKTARSFFDDKFSDNYQMILQKALGGTELERMAAFHAIVQLANKLDKDRAEKLKLYHLILRSNADFINVKKALCGIASIGSLESADLVAPFLYNSELSQEAASYYSQLAYKFAQQREFNNAEKYLLLTLNVAQQPYLANRVLVKMKEMGSEINNQYTKEISRKIGFINNWWVVGPFPNQNDIAEKTAYFPEKGINFTQSETFFGDFTARWQKIKLDDIYSIISYADLFGKKQQAAYAYAELNIPDEMEVLFKIGSNDGVVCWLNNRKVHANLVGRRLRVDEDVVAVHLKKGRNSILLKVINKGANWEACLRICDREGIPIDVSRYLVEL